MQTHHEPAQFIADGDVSSELLLALMRRLHATHPATYRALLGVMRVMGEQRGAAPRGPVRPIDRRRAAKLIAGEPWTGRDAVRP